MLEAIILCIFIAIIWGISPIMQKRLLSRVNKETMLLVGGFTATVILILMCFKESHKIKEDLSKIDFLTFVEISIAMTLGYIGTILFLSLLNNHKSYLITAITFTSPVFTAILACLWLQEKINTINVIGILLVVFGVILVAYQQK